MSFFNKVTDFMKGDKSKTKDKNETKNDNTYIETEVVETTEVEEFYQELNEYTQNDVPMIEYADVHAQPKVQDYQTPSSQAVQSPATIDNQTIDTSQSQDMTLVPIDDPNFQFARLEIKMAEGVYHMVILAFVYQQTYVDKNMFQKLYDTHDSNGLPVEVYLITPLRATNHEQKVVAYMPNNADILVRAKQVLFNPLDHSFKNKEIDPVLYQPLLKKTIIASFDPTGNTPDKFVTPLYDNLQPEDKKDFDNIGQLLVSLYLNNQFYDEPNTSLLDMPNNTISTNTFLSYLQSSQDTYPVISFTEQQQTKQEQNENKKIYDISQRVLNAFFPPEPSQTTLTQCALSFKRLYNAYLHVANERTRDEFFMDLLQRHAQLQQSNNSFLRQYDDGMLALIVLRFLNKMQKPTVGICYDTPLKHIFETSLSGDDKPYELLPLYDNRHDKTCDVLFCHIQKDLLLNRTSIKSKANVTIATLKNPLAISLHIAYDNYHEQAKINPLMIAICDKLINADNDLLIVYEKFRALAVTNHVRKRNLKGVVYSLPSLQKSIVIFSANTQPSCFSYGLNYQLFDDYAQFVPAIVNHLADYYDSVDEIKQAQEQLKVEQSEQAKSSEKPSEPQNQSQSDLSSHSSDDKSDDKPTDVEPTDAKDAKTAPTVGAVAETTNSDNSDKSTPPDADSNTTSHQETSNTTNTTDTDDVHNAHKNDTAVDEPVDEQDKQADTETDAKNVHNAQNETGDATAHDDTSSDTDTANDSDDKHDDEQGEQSEQSESSGGVEMDKSATAGETSLDDEQDTTADNNEQPSKATDEHEPTNQTEITDEKNVHNAHSHDDADKGVHADEPSHADSSDVNKDADTDNTANTAEQSNATNDNDDKPSVVEPPSQDIGFDDFDFDMNMDELESVATPANNSRM